MNILNGAIYSVNAAAILIGAAGLLSRILGVLRDRLLASQFGAGRELDIYYASFQIPDFMSAAFLLGAASAAILPIFQEYLEKDKESARRLISELSTFFFAGSVLVSFFIFIFAPVLVPLITPGFSLESRALTVTLTRIMILSSIFLGLSGILSAVVQSFERFWIYALAPILYNLGIIFGILILVPVLGVPGLAAGVVLGAALHLWLQLWAVKNLGFAPAILWRGARDGVRQVMKLSFPRVLSVSFSQITVLALVALGSTLAEGSIAVFQLAQNLYFLPIGIFGVSYAIVLFPRMSRAYISRDAEAFFRELFLGIRSILFWIAPSVVLFIVLRAHIVRVALGAGEFSWEDTRLTAAVLAILSFSMLANALASLFIKGFYALENTWKPFLINVIASLISVVLAVVLVGELAKESLFTRVLTSLLRIADLPDVRAAGLALGFAIGLVVNILLLYGALRRLARARFGESRHFPIGEILKIVLASVLAGLAAYFVRVSFSETLPLITFLQVLLHGVLAGGAGLLVYFGTLFLLREENVFSLWVASRRRLFHIKSLPPGWEEETHIREHRV